MKRKIHYAILKLFPDEARGETINVGIVAYHESSTDIRVAPNLKKIATLDPNISTDFLIELQENAPRLLAQAASIEDRHALLSSFGPIITSGLGYFMLDENENYDTEIHNLLSRFVYTPRKLLKRKYHSRSRIQTELKTIFRKAGILGKTEDDLKKKKIIPNFLISREENLRADFALKNGRWQISETIDFRVSEKTLRDTKTNLAAMKAITLDRACKILGGDTLPVVVYAAYPGHEETIESAINLLSNYAEHLFDINNKDEKADYFDRILAAAGVQQVHLG